MSAAFDQPSVLQDTNAIASDDGAETVSHNDRCWTFFGLEQLVNALLHHRFTFTVERAGCLVKQHQLRPPNQASSDAKSLPLAATQLHGRHAGADQRVVTTLHADVNMTRLQSGS